MLQRLHTLTSFLHRKISENNSPTLSSRKCMIISRRKLSRAIDIRKISPHVLHFINEFGFDCRYHVIKLPKLISNTSSDVPCAHAAGSRTANSRGSLSKDPISNTRDVSSYNWLELTDAKISKSKVQMLICAKRSKLMKKY